MKAKLNSKTINSLRPKESTYKVWDTEIKGYFLRITPKGTKTYCIFYRFNGIGKDFTIGQHGKITADIARDLAKQRLGEISQGIDIQSVKKETKNRAKSSIPNTLGKFIELKYQPWAETHIKSSKESIRVLNKDFKHLHGKKLNEISQWDIQKWSTESLKPKSNQKPLKPSTINRRIAILKGVLTKAKEWGIIEQSPLAGLKRLKTDNVGRIRWLSRAEELSLRKSLDAREKNKRNDRISHNIWLSNRDKKNLNTLDFYFVDYLKPLVLTALNTGMRRGELFDLNWSNIDFQRSIIKVEGSNSKSGKTRYIPLNAEAFETLENWKKQRTDSAIVFPSPRTNKRLNNVTTSWKNILTMSRINDFKFHDLRHHFASQLVMKGIDLNTVRELLGHSSIEQTLKYAHLSPDHKAEAVAVLNIN